MKSKIKGDWKQPWAYLSVLTLYTRWHARKARSTNLSSNYWKSQTCFRMFLSCLLIAFKCLYRLKCPLAGTNKRFLLNTIKNTLPSQKEQDQEREQKDDSKEPEPNKSRKEEKQKKLRIHPYTPSFQSRRRVSYSPPRHRSRSHHTKDKHEKRSSKRWGEWRMCVVTSQECH